MLTLIIFITASHKTYAEENPEVLQAITDEVVKLIGQDKYFEACFILDRYYPSDTQDVKALFLRARCQRGLKKFDAAIQDYTTLLKLSPDSIRVRQELLATKTEAQNAPQPKKISPAKNWFARLETGAVFDTNINTGPTSDEIEILSVPISLGIETVEAPGYTVSGLAGIVKAQSQNVIWVAKASAEYTNYDTEDDYSFTSFNISGGPTMKRGKLSISIQPGFTWQNYAGSPYNNIVDVVTRLSYKASDRLISNLRASVSAQSFYASESRDSTIFTLNPSFDFMLDDTLTISPSVFLRLEKATGSPESNDLIGFRLNAEKKLDSNFKINGGFQQSSRGYDAPDLTFGNFNRYETQKTSTLGAVFNVGDTLMPNTFLNLRYQKIQNDSNVSIYSYRRDEVSLTISKAW